MGTFKQLTASLVIAGGLTLCSPLAYASDATLTAPAGGTPLEPQGTITLQVSDSVSDARYANFFVQLDGDDITSLVSVNGRTVTYQPPVKLVIGDHILVLVEKTGAGFTELARWSLHVGGGGFKDATLTGDLSGQYNYLVADKLEGSDKVKPHSGTAVLNVQGQEQSGNWENTGKFNGFFDSKRRNNKPDADNLEIGEYLFGSTYRGENATSTTQFGNHDAGLSNMLVDRFYRRGVSERFDLGNWLSVTAFSQDPARTIGNSNITGVADGNQRADGGFARVYPLQESYGNRVFFEGGYYNAGGTIVGASSGVISNPNNTGDGWTAAAEGQTKDDKVNARADYAQTNFDDDGSGVVVSDKHDDAYKMRLAWSPIATLVPSDASPERMQVIGLYQNIGTYFRSLANNGEPIDEQRGSLTTSYVKDSFTVTGEGHAVQNNVDDERALPTDRSYGGLAQASVQPVFFNSTITPESILGRSTLTAGASFSRDLRQETPATFLGTGLDQTTLTIDGGWLVAFDKASASLTHNYTVFGDGVTQANSYHTNFTTLAVTWTPSDRFTITPSAQAQIQRKSDVALSVVDSEQYFAAIDTTWIIIPDKLTNTFHYSAMLDDDTGAGDKHNLSTEFVYQLKQAALNDPGYAIALSGDYEHGKPDPLLTTSTQDENYKVYVSFKISAPFALN